MEWWPCMGFRRAAWKLDQYFYTPVNLDQPNTNLFLDGCFQKPIRSDPLEHWQWKSHVCGGLQSFNAVDSLRIRSVDANVCNSKPIFNSQSIHSFPRWRSAGGPTTLAKWQSRSLGGLYGGICQIYYSHALSHWAFRWSFQWTPGKEQCEAIASYIVKLTPQSSNQWKRLMIWFQLFDQILR